MLPSSCLNEYHLQFRKLLVERGTRFLIVGGQARALHEGSNTKDLDVWVDISDDNRSALDECVITWVEHNPMRSLQDFSPPLPWRAGVQIKFPDADVLFLGADGEPAEIGPDDCIDLFTSIGEANFEEFYPPLSGDGSTY